MLEKIPEDDPRPIKAIDKVLSSVAAQGYESVSSAQAQGVQDMGYPVFDYTGKVVAALIVPFLAYLDGSHAIAMPVAQEQLKSAAADVSNKLGYRLE